MNNNFDEDYYERGVEKGLSGYENYRWLAHYVMPMANYLKQRYMHGTTFLDYGCAKGYLVKALRLLDVFAYGYDISEYAIKNCDPDVKDYCSTKALVTVDYVIAKDILEHVPEEEMQTVLSHINTLCSSGVIAVIPLGDNDKFRIREYEIDKTHVTKKDEVWWIKQFQAAGFVLDEFHYKLDGFKDNWSDKHPCGNGIFFFSKKDNSKQDILNEYLMGDF